LQASPESRASRGKSRPPDCSVLLNSMEFPFNHLLSLNHFSSPSLGQITSTNLQPFHQYSVILPHQGIPVWWIERTMIKCIA
jgi:hypothetical protein